MGELLGNPLAEKGSVLTGDDFNNYKNSGIYGVNVSNGQAINLPSGAGLGTLIVFKSPNNSAIGGAPLVQILVEYQAKFIFIRSLWVGVWSQWRKLECVSI